MQKGLGISDSPALSRASVKKQLRAWGCPWSTDTSEEAIGSCVAGNEDEDLMVVKYLRENGCPWDHQTIEAAAKHRSNPKHLGCLWYAVENKCPGWKAYTHLLALD